MKNSMLLFISMLLSIAAARTVQSQGKEQAIQWINQYAAELLSGKHSAGVIGVSRSGKVLSVKCRTFSGEPQNEAFFHGCSLHIPLEAIIIRPFSYTKEAWPAYKARFLTNGRVISAGCYGKTGSFSIWASDVQQLERVYNAIIHLAKLNGARPPVPITKF